MEIEQLSSEWKMGQERNERLSRIWWNEYTIYPDLWDTIKAVLRGKFVWVTTKKKKKNKKTTN